MFSLFKIMSIACLTGLATSLLVTGVVGIWAGVPLAFLEFLPGDDVEQLRLLPRSLLLSGVGGFVIGWLGGFANQLTRQSVNRVICVLAIGTCVMLTIRWTHPELNVNLESSWLDYLESYRLTLLAALTGTAGVVLLGWLLKPFRQKEKSG